MRRSMFAAAVLLLVSLLPAGAVLAAVPDDPFPDVMDSGFWVEPGASADEAGLSGAVATARNEGIRLMLVVLDEDPAGGATAFADAVLDRAGEGTVLVLTAAGFVGATSTEFSQAELEEALDAADGRGGSDAEYARTFAGGVVAIRNGQAPGVPDDDGGGGAGGLIVFLVVVALLVALVAWVVWRGSRRSRRRAAEELEAARAELRAQLDAMANDILDLSDRVPIGPPAAADHFQRASATYTTATEAFERATTLGELAELAGAVDEATWELDAAEAIVEGKPVPDKPPERQTARCFFDPTHPRPVEDAELKTAAGAKRIRVCRDDAAKLRRGEAPSPRMVSVGRRSVPAPSAPRSHGGGGFGALDAFSILLRGMAGSGVAHRWGTASSSRRRSSASSFRSSSSSSSRQSSSASGRSSSSSSSRSRTGRRRSR